MTDEKYRGSGADPLSKRILNSIKPFSGEHTSKWLAALSTDAAKDSVVIKGDADPAQEPPRSMAAWVDNLFDHFQRYAFDFSRMCNEPELQVNCTRPTIQNETKPPGQEASVTSIGYIATTQWALVVRGEFFKIGIYVVPVGFLMGFKLRHDEFPLYMEMLASQTARNKINWMIDGQPVSMDQSSALAKKLFAHLVMVARGEARDTDKFSFTSSKSSAAQRADEGLPQRPSSFGSKDNKVELLKPEWLLEENPAQSPGQGGSSSMPTHNAAQQMQTFPPQSNSPLPGQPSMPSADAMRAMQPPQYPGMQAQQNNSAMPGQYNQVAHGQQNFPGAQPASSSPNPANYPAPTFSAVSGPSSGQPLANKPSSIQDILQQNLVLVLNECNHFAGALDEQLNLLTPVGVKAIQNQEMETASEVMQRAKRLKALLDAVVTFTNEWKDSAK